MKAPLRFSIRELLMAGTIVALVLTLVVQFGRQQQAEERHRFEIYQLESRLRAVYQLVGTLPVEDPDRAYVLAAPSHAYGRWVWRVHLPEGRRYAVRIAVGTYSEQNGSPQITAAKGHDQHFGIAGHGETVIVAEEFRRANRQWLGVSVGDHDSPCMLTPEVAQCLAQRLPYREEQLGNPALVDLAADERIDLLMRWYPPDGEPVVVPSTAPNPTLPPGPPPGFAIWLEPM